MLSSVSVFVPFALTITVLIISTFRFCIFESPRRPSWNARGLHWTHKLPGICLLPGYQFFREQGKPSSLAFFEILEYSTSHEPVLGLVVCLLRSTRGQRSGKCHHAIQSCIASGNMLITGDILKVRRVFAVTLLHTMASVKAVTIERPWDQARVVKPYGMGSHAKW